MRTRTPEGATAWSVGVDLGGSRIRVVAVDLRGRRRRAVDRTPGLAGAPAWLRRLWRRWGLRGTSTGALVVASRGVWTASERRAQARRLRGLARRAVVISDAEAAFLGALGDGPGILLLAGTGSMALARDRSGRWARAGGAGPLLGDEGSAFWIGREWLAARGHRGDRQAARRIGRGPDPVGRVAALAPRVLARARGGSRPERAIVGRAQEALAALLVQVAGRPRAGPPIAVSWAGGLLEDARFRAGIWRAARGLGLDFRPEPPRESAAAAAARLAARLGRAASSPAHAQPGAGRARPGPRQAR